LPDQHIEEATMRTSTFSPTKKLRSTPHQGPPPRDQASMLGSLRERLLARRRAIMERVARTDNALGELDHSVPSEVEEEAQELNQARLVARLGQHGRAEIEAIDSAIARMEHGDYGSCEECEEPIDVERLEVLPTARLCTTCAEASERNARVRAQMADADGGEI
jgi:RNA polymerase-binding protein DksA